MARNKDLRTPQQIAISEAMKRHWRKRKADGNKYGNRKTTLLGEQFDSKREALRHLVLRDMVKHGEIVGLERQPVFRLVVNGKLICKYIPDWQYRIPSPTGSRIVCEDAKGVRTPAFNIKWKLAQALYPDIEWKLS